MPDILKDFYLVGDDEGYGCCDKYPIAELRCTLCDMAVGPSFYLTVSTWSLSNVVTAAEEHWRKEHSDGL